MTARAKINSNETGGRLALEESIGVLPASPVWNPIEPNKWADTGSSVSGVARDPINENRQRQKQTLTGLEAMAGFDTDFTQLNHLGLLEGVLMADRSKKSELAVATVDADSYTVASGGAAYVAGTLLAARGFAAPTNNGLHLVAAGATATDVPVATALIPATGATGTIERCGHQFAAGDLEIDVSGAFPALVTTDFDLTTLGLRVGEWVYVGGDLPITRFAQAANSGFARVRSIAANRVELDKTDKDFVADDGAAKTIQVFIGSSIRNERGDAIKPRSYTLERTLGRPDNASNARQAQYVSGLMANEFQIKQPTEAKVESTLSYMGLTSFERTAQEGLLAGERPDLVPDTAFNTSSDYSRIRLFIYDDVSTAPAPLFAYSTQLDLALKNNISADKALGVFGAFDLTLGNLEVDAKLNVYLADVRALTAVRQNLDTTLDWTLVKENSGVTFDLPLCSLSSAVAAVEKNKPVMAPVDVAAAAGGLIDPGLDHTILVQFWSYLPDRAS